MLSESRCRLPLLARAPASITYAEQSRSRDLASRELFDDRAVIRLSGPFGAGQPADLLPLTNGLITHAEPTS